MWGVDKMKIRWTNQAEEQQAEVFLEKGRAIPENFRKLGKKRGGDCRIDGKKEGFSEEEWIQMLCNGYAPVRWCISVFPERDEDAGKTESIRKQGFTV